MTPAPLRTRALDMLIDAGTWVSRLELDTLTTCPPALDDVLCELVESHLAEYREQAGYRLAGGIAARRAAQLQRKTGKRAAAVGVPGKEFYTFGVAEVLPAVGLVMYEMQIPNPEPGPDALEKHLQQVNQLLGFVNSRGDLVCAG